MIGTSLSNPFNATCIHVKWEPPPRGWYKLNTDGACCTKESRGGLGGVIRNHRREWVIGFACSYPINKPVLLQLYALKAGLQIAVQQNFHPLIINTDSIEILQMLKHDNALYTNIIYECRCLMQQMGRVEVEHTFREKNMLADALSKAGMKGLNMGDQSLLAVPPPYVNSCFWDDLASIMYSRKLSTTNMYLNSHGMAQTSFVNALEGTLSIT